MFQPEPGKELPEKRAFKWFCQWVFSVAKRGHGKNILFADELAMFIDRLNSQMPCELQLIVRQGRAENLELLTATPILERLSTRRSQGRDGMGLLQYERAGRFGRDTTLLPGRGCGDGFSGG